MKIIYSNFPIIKHISQWRRWVCNSWCRKWVVIILATCWTVLWTHNSRVGKWRLLCWRIFRSGTLRISCLVIVVIILVTITCIYSCILISCLVRCTGTIVIFLIIAILVISNCRWRQVFFHWRLLRKWRLLICCRSSDIRILIIIPKIWCRLW